MHPWITVDRTCAPDGTELVLARRGEEWVVRAEGRVLMSSRTHGSEEALAVEALGRVSAPRMVLLGGLGLGFTLRAALDRLPTGGRLVVAELVARLVDWNRGPVAHLAGRPLDDPRVEIRIEDVVGLIAGTNRGFDAVLLDVDNGPSPLAHRSNGRLYSDRGVYACHRALRPGGVLAVWSATPDRIYRQRLERAGFSIEERTVPARGGSRGARHVLYLAVRSRAPERS